MARRRRACHWRNALMGLLALSTPAGAQETLPYSQRALSFSGFGTTVRGDIRTVGMAGATVGLADTFIAAVDNPAGLAMTLRIGDIHYTGNFARDAQVQDVQYGAQSSSVGLALALYPWAVSVGYLSYYGEDAKYLLVAAPDNPLHLTVVTRELVLSAARVFADNRLSLGVSLVLGQSARAIDFDTPRNAGASFSSYAAGAAFGAMVRLPARLLVGASFTLPMHYAASARAADQTPDLPGLFQSVEVPWRAGIGLGFIPNRWLRADFTLHLVGTSDHTALARDEAATVGQHLTVQPRAGVAYVFADYYQFRGTLFLGTYFESTRTAGTGDRFHGTGGVEVKAWVLTAGGGLDLAPGYRSYLFSFGVDVFEAMARLGVIPTEAGARHVGFLPRPLALSDAGLARPLVSHWSSHPTDIDPIAAALAIPKRLPAGMRNAQADIEQLGRRIAEFFKIRPPEPTVPAAPSEHGGAAK